MPLSICCLSTLSPHWGCHKCLSHIASSPLVSLSLSVCVCVCVCVNLILSLYGAGCVCVEQLSTLNLSTLRPNSLWCHTLLGSLLVTEARTTDHCALHPPLVIACRSVSITHPNHDCPAWSTPHPVNIVDSPQGSPLYTYRVCMYTYRVVQSTSVPLFCTHSLINCLTRVSILIFQNE
jgi:hypothetical protein